MTEQQIKNVIDLCKGQPLSKVDQLGRIYRQYQIDAMAKYFNCHNDWTTVMAHLINGK